MRSGKYPQKLRQLHSRHGPVVRVATDEVSFTGAPAWRAIFAPKGMPPFAKSPRWFVRRQNGCYGIMTSPMAEHPRFRRAFAPAFTEKALAAQAPLVDRHAAALVQKLRHTSAGDKPVDITKEIEYVVFDTAAAFTFSERFNCLDAADNRPYITEITAAMRGLTMRAMQRMLRIETLCHWASYLIPSVNTHKAVYPNTVTEWTSARLEGESDDDDQREDLMAHAIRAASGRGLLSRVEVKNAIGDFMVAGTETIASTVVAALQCLLVAPALMQDLQEEIRGAMGGREQVEVQKLAGLKLLNAVIDETLRLCPNLPAVLARVVPEPGAEICGYHIPGGTFISFGQFAAYRDPSNFSEPDKFLPERWLDASAMDKHNADVYHPFNIGPRNCIGKHWGLMVARSLLASILFNFDITAAEPAWKWEDQEAYFVWEKRALLIKLQDM